MGSPPDGAVKVFYIAGVGHSGSTVLANILGEIDGFFSGGELASVWTRGVAQDQPCGCGTPFSACPVWTRTMAATLEGLDEPAVERLRRTLVGRVLRARVGPREARGLFRAVSEGGDLAEYGRVLGRFYRAMADATQSAVVVDSSKHPLYAEVLHALPELELHVVHLVRDPRAMAYSWLRRHGTRSVRRAYEAASSWTRWNRCLEALWREEPDRYLRLRYEDFVERPRETVSRLVEGVGEGPKELPFVGDRSVALGANHMIWGNPNRFTAGTVEVRADDEWRGRLGGARKALVSSLTWPLLVRYGYPLARV